MIILESGLLPTWVTFPNLFRDAFGIPSPTSGVTRALRAIVAGRVGDALSYHTPAVLVGLFAVFFVVYFPVSLATKKRIQTSPQVDRVAFWMMVLGTLVQWVIKIAYMNERWW